jgi:hypothetical protein
VQLHQWLGIVTAGLSLVLIGSAFLGRWRNRASKFYRLGLLACAVLVAVTGHLGGALTHGDGYLTELLFPPSEEPKVAVEHSPASQPAIALTVDFARDVHPILATSCFECHGSGSHKGGLRLDTPGDIMTGGKSGAVVVAGHSADSLLIQRVLGLGGKKRMPVDHPPLSDAQINILKTWIDEGAHAGSAPAVARKRWTPPLEPVHVEVPGPIDYLLEKYYQRNHFTPPAAVEDHVYARRVYLDTIGMLPTPEELEAFVQDKTPDKRARLVRKLLDDDQRYAEHWLTFWNDALRNDYKGPGYIDGGRKQITEWLYNALLNNMPYDRFVAELIDPVPGSEGFVKGIVWRGAVSASQRPELQAAQNISQVFMGINMKCNSCHDSFISDWKLSDAYGLAGVYSDKPLEMFRCEQPQGKIAPVQFMYPKIGSIDGNAPRQERMKQLARLMTCPENGRLSRTIVNRLWARFLGHGLVEPVDEMDNEPWDADLLNWLAEDLVKHNYNLKQTIFQILTSKAYQLPSVGMKDPSEKSFVFAGPVVRRLDAEQFCDAVSQLTGVWHTSSPAPVPEMRALEGQMIWDDPGARTSAKAGSIYLRKVFDLPVKPMEAIAAAACDDRYRLFVNGHEVSRSDAWIKPGVADIKPYLVAGRNEFDVIAINDPPDGKNPNLAGFWMMASIRLPSAENLAGEVRQIVSDRSWRYLKPRLSGWMPGEFSAIEWAPVSEVGDVGRYKVAQNFQKEKKQPAFRDYRAVWVNNDTLMSALGRPNREQVVTYRPTAATTLQMLELTNGSTLYDILKKGADNWQAHPLEMEKRIERLYLFALGRKPTPAEAKAAAELVGASDSREGYEDLLWSVLMLPEFQLIY